MTRYKNMDELKEALSPLNYYGFEKDFSKLARKALLRKIVFENEKT